MPRKDYNTFYQGIAQDDFLTNGAGFIEHNNLDGLSNGYGITLGPKVHKQLLTDDKPIIGTSFRYFEAGNLTKTLCGGNDGVLYYLNSTDNTPEHILEVGDVIYDEAPVDIVNIYALGDSYYIFFKHPDAGNRVGVAQISFSDADAGNWENIVKDYIRISIGLIVNYVGSGIIFNNYIYYPSRSSIVRIDGALTPGAGSIPSENVFGFPSDNVVGLSLQGTTVVVYTDSGLVYLWDGVNDTYQGVNTLGSRIQKVASKTGFDYITTEDGQLYIGSGLSFQRVTKPKRSNRMKDNSVFESRLDFSLESTNFTQGTVINPALDDVYLATNESTPGIYKYGHLIPGMQNSLHKVITKNHAGTPIDIIYNLDFYEKSLRRLFFSYKAGSTYGIDYIDLKTLETAEDGFGVTEVFSGGVQESKKIDGIEMTFSNTSGDNYIKLYYRVDNGDWELIRTYNEDTDTIKQDDITTVNGQMFKKFTDVQFKIELHNETGGENAPIVHGLSLFYNIIS